jgi:hypothetical protein
MIHGIKRKKKIMLNWKLSLNSVFRSFYLMQITGMPLDACVITISTKLCIHILKEPEAKL